MAVKHCAGEDLDEARGGKRRAMGRVAPSLPLHFRPADVSAAVKVRGRREGGWGRGWGRGR